MFNFHLHPPALEPIDDTSRYQSFYFRPFLYKSRWNEHRYLLSSLVFIFHSATLTHRNNPLHHSHLGIIIVVSISWYSHVFIAFSLTISILLFLIFIYGPGTGAPYFPSPRTVYKKGDYPMWSVGVAPGMGANNSGLQLGQAWEKPLSSIITGFSNKLLT